MKKHLFLAVSLTLSFACTPPADNGGGGKGGSSSQGGSGGSTGGRGGSSGGSTGGSSSTGGSTGGSSSTGGSGGSTGGTGGGTGGSGGSGGSTGGTGGSTGGTGGSTGGTGGGMTDAKPADTGGGAETGAPPGGVASALHDQVFKVACPNQSGMAASCTVGSSGANDPLRSFEKSFAIGGDPNKVYKVTLKFCGLFEGRALTGCAATGSTPNVCVDGMTVNTPSYNPTYPTLILDVPEPKHIYHLNRKFRNDQIEKHDYEHTFDIKGGTTVVIKSDGGNNGGIYTPYKSGAMTCPTVPGIAMQPFLGQFFHVQLVKAE
jgi:hypothetical protein